MNNDADGHWLAGLTDGEGCFTFYVRDRTDGHPQPRIDFGYKLTLRADDWATILEARRILGVQGSYYSSPNNRGPNGKPISTLAVCGREEIAVVIDFFRQYPLRSKKRRDFEIWTEAFEFYMRAMAGQLVQSVAKGVITRPSIAGNRRPVAGTMIRKFRRCPAEIVSALRVFADRLREGRAYIP